MKSILKFILLSVLFSSCKSWDASKISVKKEPLTPKLLTLERKIEDVVNTVIATNPDEMKIFTKEVEENLIDPYGDKYGYIIMKQNIIKMKLSKITQKLLLPSNRCPKSSKLNCPNSHRLSPHVNRI